MKADVTRERTTDALAAAREYLRLSRESLDVHMQPQRACAQALLGILRMQIELVEGRAS